MSHAVDRLNFEIGNLQARCEITEAIAADLAMELYFSHAAAIASGPSTHCRVCKVIDRWWAYQTARTDT